MKSKMFSLIFVCLFGFNFSDPEIVVHLEKQNQLKPIYIGHTKKSSSSLTDDYLNKIEGILLFDLSISGFFETKYNLKEKEELLANDSFKEAFANPKWSLGKYHAIVLPKLDGQSFSLMLYNVEFNSIKHFKNIALSGNIDADREKIHKLSDAIVKSLSGKKGIASTKILYALQTKVEKNKKTAYLSEIWECDYDGANARCLTSATEYCITPIYYPAKRSQSPEKFLYVTYEKGPSKIFISSLYDKTSQPFIKLRGNQLLPTISKDRSKIAFICDVSGRADLFIQPIHPERGLLGKPLQVYSFPSSVQASPSFSPDTKKIAFVSDKEKTPKIYIIDVPSNLKGRSLPQATCITTKNRENTCPSWSPDGKKIAYSSKTDGIRQIWIYDIETGEEKQLTSGSTHKENPCWAPDSLHIVFNTADSDSSELFLVNLNQQKTVKITNGSGCKYYPAWQP